MTEYLRKLADRVEGMNSTDNQLDVLVEVALFCPNKEEVSVRANDAGTKVIYVDHEGREKTYLAAEWTFNKRSREQTAALLRARARQGDKP